MSDNQPPANNTLETIEDGIMLLTQRGHQTRTSAGQFQATMDQRTAELHAQGKKALILVDLTEVTGHDPEAREDAKKRMSGDYDALAICGSNVTTRMIVNWIIKFVANDRIRFFGTREEATAWLKSHL